MMFALVNKLYNISNENLNNCKLYHIDAGLGTFAGRSLLAAGGVAASSGAPCTFVLSVACDAQRTVGVFTMRAENRALVQDNIHCVHMVIAIPDNGHTRLIFASGCLVRILETNKGFV